MTWSVTSKVGTGRAHFRKSKIPWRISKFTKFNQKLQYTQPPDCNAMHHQDKHYITSAHHARRAEFTLLFLIPAGTLRGSGTLQGGRILRRTPTDAYIQTWVSSFKTNGLLIHQQGRSQEGGGATIVGGALLLEGHYCWKYGILE